MLDTTPMRRAMLDAPDEELRLLERQVREALEGDSNDAEHDALVCVADTLKIDYDAEKAYEV